MDALVSSKFFEALNGTFFAAFFCLLFIFGRFLFQVWREHRAAADGFCRFYVEARPAVAIAVVFFGDFVIRGSVWVPRWLINHGFDDVGPYATQFVTSIITGVVVCLFGSWCVARVYGSRTDALITVLVSLLFGLGMAYPW